MGVFDKALQHYTNALELFKRFPDWMAKVQFAATIRVASTGARKAVPWGATTRQSQLGLYPLSVGILQGQVEFQRPVQQGGGVVQQANLYPITPQEIVRCTTLALRRRAALLGPVSKYDPLTADLIGATAGAIGPANHWSESWADLERGLALLAGGKETQATAYLQRAVLAAGEFDHPMTSIALFELGRLAMLHGDYAAASKFFEEATYSAVNYPRLRRPGRGLPLRHDDALDGQPQGTVSAAGGRPCNGRRSSDLRQLRASLLLSAAENYAVLGETAASAGHARRGPRRPSADGRWATAAIGSRLNYLSALVAFQQRRIAEGNAALAAAMGYMRHGSLWLFHIGLADELYVGRRRSRRGRPWTCSATCSAIRGRPIGPSTRWSRWPS